MKCPYCGKEIAPDAQFCRYCGKEIEYGGRRRVYGRRYGCFFKKLPILIAAIVLVVLAAAAVIYFTQFYDREELSDGVQSVEKIGNTSGNLACGGRIAQQGEWIYYSSGDAIYKTKDMAEKGEKLFATNDAYAMNVVGNWVYYISSSWNDVYAIQTDGSVSNQMSAGYNCVEVIATEKYLVLQVADREEYLRTGYSRGDIYKYPIEDGEEVELLVQGECELIGMQDGFIYYTEGVDNRDLYRIDLNGRRQEIIIRDFSSYSTVVVEDGWIYGAVPNDDEKDAMISRINIETGERQSLYATCASQSDWEFSLNVKNDWIYFQEIVIDYDAGEVDYFIAKIRTDGTEHSRLCSVEDITEPTVLDKGVYIREFDYDEEWGKTTFTWKQIM